jgi:aryl-alcohol dehydrogenase-like predicted oxidoreductase
MDFEEKIILGTANFGQKYGVANDIGQLPMGTIASILQMAKTSNIKLIDTASGYGEAESILGIHGGKDFQYISKIGHLKNTSSEGEIINCIEVACKRLNVNTLDTILLHRTDQILSSDGKAIVKNLDKVKAVGLVDNVGVSVYNTQELKQCFSIMDLDTVQLPFNVFNQRFADQELIGILKKKQIEVHARSVFLQGLLLQKTEEIKGYFYPWIGKIERWHDICREFNLSQYQLALTYALNQLWIDKIVIGVDSPLHLEQILNMNFKKINGETLRHLEVHDEELINPSLWKLEGPK